MRLTSNLGPSFLLGPESIRRLEKGTEDVLAYDNITRVRALLIGRGGVLELSAGDETGNEIEFVRGLIFKKRYDPRALPASVLP